MDITRFKQLWPIAERNNWSLEYTNLRDPETDKPIFMVSVPENSKWDNWAACWSRLDDGDRFILVPNWYDQELILYL